MWIFTGASEISSCCASVLTATKSTWAMPASIIRFTALIPAPPTPTTRITARYDATSPATWSRGALSGMGVTNRLAGGVYGSARGSGSGTGATTGGSAGASRAVGTSTTSATGSTARGAAAGISTTGASGCAAASAAFSAAAFPSDLEVVDVLDGRLELDRTARLGRDERLGRGRLLRLERKLCRRLGLRRRRLGLFARTAPAARPGRVAPPRSRGRAPRAGPHACSRACAPSCASFAATISRASSR